MFRLLFSILMLCATTVAAEAVDDVSSMYVSKRFWQAMDWTAVGKSALWSADSWLPYTGKQGDDATFVKKMDVVVFGQKVEADLAYMNTVEPTKDYTTIGGQMPRQACSNVLQEIGYWADQNYVQQHGDRIT